jgi:hypothetical protein
VAANEGIVGASGTAPGGDAAAPADD